MLSFDPKALRQISQVFPSSYHILVADGSCKEVYYYVVNTSLGKLPRFSS